jgi:putative lipoic acid-binding regulatory protein
VAITCEINGQKLELEYPCKWCYKVVGYERAGIEIAVLETFSERPYTLVPSNTSISGKFIA